MSDKLIKIAVLLLIALFAGYLYQNIESYEKEINLPWSLEAKTNPYLAAERFITAAGGSVVSGGSLSAIQDLPVAGDLLIDNVNHIATRAKAEQLMDWMQTGGHLVVGVPRNMADDHVLLSRFGVSRFDIDLDDDDDITNNVAKDRAAKKDIQANAGVEIDQSVEKSGEKNGDEDLDEELDENELQQNLSEVWEEYNRDLSSNQQDDKEQSLDADADTDADNRQALDKKAEKDRLLVELSFTNVEEVLRASFSSYNSLYHPAIYDWDDDPEYEADESLPEPIYWVHSDEGTHFVQFEVGDGLLTLLSDISIWQSWRIHLYDHAYLLNVFVEPDGEFVILYGNQMPSLLDFLRSHAIEILAAFLLLLVFIIWRVWPRFGPVREQLITSRRSIAEHVTAVGDYYCSQGLTDELLKSLRHEVGQRSAALQTDYLHWSQAERTHWLAAESGWDAMRVNRAVFTEELRSDTVLVKCINDLYALNQLLSERRISG